MKKYLAVVIVLLNGFLVGAQQSDVIQKYNKFLSGNFNPDSSVVTFNSVSIGGKRILYKSTTGTLPVYDEEGKIIAGVFSVYYARTGVPSTHRPIVFLFNGGYGSPAKWLHMGYVGPRVVNLDEEGYPKQPFGVIENPYSILDIADLVFVDPVGTGHSHAVPPVIQRDKRFFNENADVAYLSQFIETFLDRYGRRISPVFLLGESAGGRRVARMSGVFNLGGPERRKPVNLVGTILLSSAKLFGNDTTGLIPKLFDIVAGLPYYCRHSYKQGLLASSALALDSNQLFTQAKRFAIDTLFPAVVRVAELDQQTKRLLAHKIWKYTGVDSVITIKSEFAIDSTNYIFLCTKQRKIKIPTHELALIKNEMGLYFNIWQSASDLVTEALTYRYYKQNKKDNDIDQIQKLTKEVEDFTVEKLVPALINAKGNPAKIDKRLQDQVLDLVGGYPTVTVPLKSSHGGIFEEVSNKEIKQWGWSYLDDYDTRYNAEAGYYMPKYLAIDGPLLHYLQNDLKYKTLVPYNDDPSFGWGYGRKETLPHLGNSAPIIMLTHSLKISPYMKVLVQTGYYDRATNYLNQRLNQWQINTNPDYGERVFFKAYRGGHMMYFRKSERIKASNDLREFIVSCLPKLGKTLGYKDLRILETTQRKQNF